MKIFLLLFFFELSVSDCFAKCNQFGDSMEIIRNRAVSSILDNFVDPSTIDDYLALYQEDGSFSDLDYSSRALTNWPTYFHLVRIRDMAVAYASNSYEKVDLFSYVERGLLFYYNRDAESDNWYWRSIAEPLRLGEILISMTQGQHQLPDSLVQNLCVRWKNHGDRPENYTVANRVDVAVQNLYLAILINDSEMLEQALYYIFEPIQYSKDDEGFQIDNSFTQHGRQIYIGAYAEVVLSNVLRVAEWTKDTEFEITLEKRDLLRSFMLQTFCEVIRGQTMNWNCLGRAVSRKGYLKKTDERIGFFKSMKYIDPDFNDDYENVIKRLEGSESSSYKITPNHHHWFRSDYTQYVGRELSIGVRCLSNRSERIEIANGENEKAYFMSFGSTAITNTGDEYYDIMPLWDYFHIPGVTAPVLDQIPYSVQKEAYDFVLGVSDSIYGVTAMEYVDQFPLVQTGAKKGWFFFDNEVVCLGNGIHFGHITHTTIDQCWGGKALYYKSKGWDPIKIGDCISSSDIKFVKNGGICYYFPSGGNVTMKYEEKEGCWYDVNSSQSKDNVKGIVFKLYLNHHIPNEKKDTLDTSYEYVLMPSYLIGDINRYNEDRSIRTLCNTDSVMAVLDKDKEILSAIFFKASNISLEDVCISVSRPCAIILKKLFSPIKELHVANAYKKETIDLYIKTIEMDKGIVAKADFSFWDDINAGRSLKLIINTDQSLNINSKKNNCDINYKMIYSLDGKIVANPDDVRGGVYIVRSVEDGSILNRKIISRRK